MLEFGEGLWYIITSGHKESQHFYNCASIYFKSKTNVRNRKEKKGNAYLRPGTVTAQLASPVFYLLPVGRGEAGHDARARPPRATSTLPLSLIHI